MILRKILPYTFLLVILSLFLYSFTQVSLSLALTKFDFAYKIQSTFQNIGYFQRDISTSLFLVIVSALTLFYIYFLFLALEKKLKIKTLRNLILFTGVILSFSYIAFSYDLFNYIFDAKIITFYQENPYFKKALDFPTDPMLSFMHWTHRYYPYGPFWLVLTVPISFAGLQIFLFTYFLFKFIATAFYFGSVYLIYKINKKINRGSEIFNTVLFALNPLVIIESLVSSHNDIAMVFFSLLGIHLYLNRKRILGITSVILSAAIKIPSVVLLFPMFLNLLPINKKYKLDEDKFFWSIVILSLFGIFYSMTQLEIQPWYFLWVLPFIALLKPNKYVISLTIGISLGLLLRYSVFLYSGNWDGILVPARNIITIISITLSLLIGFVWSRKKSYNLS